MTANLMLLNSQDEEVNGIVIGDIVNPYRAKLVYDGKAQHHRFCFGKSQKEVENSCRDILKNKKAELGVSFKDVYPKELWEIRIYKDSEEW